MEFTLNETLDKCLVTILEDNKYHKLLTLFSNLNKLNNELTNNVDIDIENLEETLLMLFRTTEDTDNVMLGIDSILKDELLPYLQLYGIYFNQDEDIPLYLILDIVDMLVYLYSLDVTIIPQHIELLTVSMEDDNITTFLKLFKYYSNREITSLYMLFLHIDDIFYKQYIELFNKNLEASTIEIDQLTLDIINGLNSIDERFSNTKIIRYISKYGYIPTTFDKLKDNLYRDISSPDITSYDDIVFEIIAVLYLATDTRGKKIELTDDVINISWTNDLFGNIDNKTGEQYILEQYNTLQETVNIRMLNVTK